MKRMLFNATQAEELRVAIVDGQKLIDLDIESAAKEQRKSNIYKAVITRIEPSLEAAFVDYGAERHGFLPFKEISRSYFKPGVDAGKARIQDVLSTGQELIVQVEKDERGNKGAALTTYISLAGRYLVLMPNNPRGGGVSRRIEGEERQELREVMDQLQVPSGMSLIARTAGIGRTLEELQWDLNYLLQLWGAIDGAAKAQGGAFLIYQESSLVIRAIRDYFHAEIGEILIDTDDIFEQAQQFMAHVMPATVSRVKRYRDDVPLFSRFQIEHQIESAYSRQVNLPSGGAVVIDHTEALVAVDVNSGRATKGSDIEETAFRTNCEAADEIARQLRLRDLGGLIVIDFIDMESSKNQREVENRLRDALHHDRARVQTGKISRFGLLELSRQRLRPALAETSYITCPRCTGTGHIRSTESAALHILRILEEEAMKENTGAIHCQVPVDVATFLLNEKRVDIARIEVRHRVNLLIVPNRHLETPQQEIVRLRHDQLNAEGPQLASYQMAEKPAETTYQPPSAQTETKASRPEAAVKGITPDQPAPVVEARPAAQAPAETSRKEPGFFGKIAAWFRGESAETQAAANEAPAGDKATRGRGGRDGQRDGQREGRDRDRNGRGRRDGQRDSRERSEPRRESREDNRGENRGENRGQGERRPRNEPRRDDNRTQESRPPREPKEPKEPKEPREPREARSPRPPRDEPVAQLEATAVPPAPTVDGDAPNGEARGRGRGRRGRGRGDRRDEAAAVAADAIGVSSDAPAGQETSVPPVTGIPAPESAVEPSLASIAVPAADVAPAVVDAPAVESIVIPDAPLPPEPQASPVPTEIAPAAIASGPLDSPQPIVVPAPVAQEVPAVQPAPPLRDVSADLQQAGLVMIETASASPRPAVAESAMPLGRKPRPVIAVQDEALQMVETRRE